MQRWIRSADEQMLVNVEQITLVTSTNDQRSTWVIRLHHSGLMVDVMRRDGETARDEIEAEFERLAAWLVGNGLEPSIGDRPVFELDTAGEDAEPDAPVPTP